MKTIEKEITGNIINVIMQNEDSDIEEVVVTALGISKSIKSLSYSVGSDTRRSHRVKKERFKLFSLWIDRQNQQLIYWSKPKKMRNGKNFLMLI